jgi:hypothetical protein
MSENSEMSGPELYEALQEMAIALMGQGAPPSGIAWAMLIQGVQASAQMGIPAEQVRQLVDQAIHHAYASPPPDPSTT